MKKLVTGLFLSLLVFSSGYAADQAFERLINTKCLKCKFGPGASADWEGTEVRVELGSFDTTVVFDSIDSKAGKARLIGNQGASDVLVLPTAQGLTFIEHTGVGNVIFTTVFAEYDKGKTGFISVQSRHMNLPGGPLCSQYHGTCRVWE